MKNSISIATLLFLASLAGCNHQTTAQSSNIEQKDLCEVDGWRHDDVSSACKPGQKVVFLPGSWGNEQLPIKFIAVNCDLRHSVAMNNGGVVCIYLPISVSKNKEK